MYVVVPSIPGKEFGSAIRGSCEYNGDIYIYQSDDHFSPMLNAIRARQRFGPDHFDTVADRATNVSHHCGMVPGDEEAFIPTLLSTSSNCSQSNEEMPVVTLGSPLSSTAPPPRDVAVAVGSAVPIRQRQPYPLAVDFFDVRT